MKNSILLKTVCLYLLLLSSGASARDQDGVLNKDDKCAKTPEGTAVGKEGCPKKEAAPAAKSRPAPVERMVTVDRVVDMDRDDDGLTDSHDQCPDRAGPVENGGCPVTKKVSIAGMVRIPAGCFDMGSNDRDYGDDDEMPLHRVCVGAFSMDKYEVTMGDYARVTGKRPWIDCRGEYCTPEDERLPAYYMDWNEAKSYCESQGKRLPTEAEFEYANRADGAGSFPWGNDEGSACRYANVADSSILRKWSDWIAFACDDGYAMLAPVGSFLPNAWGLYDMAGNVWEWTGDWHDSDYYASGPRQDPQGLASGSYRVARGGGWHSYPSSLRSAGRGSNVPGFRGGDLGFRCVSPE